MYVCVLKHCKITHPIVDAVSKKKAKKRRKTKQKSVTSCTIHSLNIYTYMLSIYLFLYYTIHTHKHAYTHTQNANDIKLQLLVRVLVCYFLSRAIQTSLLYITIFCHHLLVKYTKQSVCFFAPSTTLCLYGLMHTPFYITSILHFFIFECMSVGVFARANMYQQRYNSIGYSFH